jgi:radical SAM modification target selenobiotic family peptide
MNISFVVTNPSMKGGENMDKDQIKSLVAGLGIASLVAGVSIAVPTHAAQSG